MVRTRTTNRNANRNESTSNQEPEAAAPARGPRRDAPVNGEDAAHERAARGNGAGTTAAADTRPADNAPTRSAAPGERTTAPASNGTAVATQSDQRSLSTSVNAPNAFESYGAAMSMTSITGTLIKFNKGDWVTGDDEDLEENTELVANMDQLMVGWIKWVDQRPTEQIMGTVVSGYQAPRRNELGDTDQAEWEVDEQGRPRDPWQFSNYIVMKDPGESTSEEHLYTFATSSKGGLGAIGVLCREFGKEMRTRPDQYPIVRLGADSYRHPTYGRIHTPIIKIVGWEDKSLFDTAGAVDEQDDEVEEAAAPQAAPAGRSQRAARAR